MRVTCGVLLLTLLATAPVAAQPKHWHDDKKHWNKHWHGDDDDDADAHHGAGCYFKPQEVRLIREYYEPRYRSLPPGLAKRFHRTGRLPPGWERKMEPLPVVVERRLVAPPPGYQRGYLDGAVVVYSPRTQVVIDVVTIGGR